MGREALQALNEQSLTALEQGMLGYPPNIPHSHQQTVRDAIQSYRNGDRDPELILALSIAMSQAVANVLRHKVYGTMLEGANRLSF